MSVEVPPPPASSTTRSSPAVPPIDLRHMTSNTLLASAPADSNRRASQHLQATVRKGSRSPSSIPSSPTSVHSSSSAIFERDIEPMHLPTAPPPPGAKKDPHRTARSKNTETLEQSVPSVLDSAASILASMSSDDGGDSISVIAPAPLSSSGLLDQSTVRSRSSGFASPIGSFRSRSPSPSPRANRNSLLLNIPSPTPHAAATPSPAVPVSGSPPLTARQFVDPATPTSTITSPANKRLSFMSYSDLLASTPAATQPLSALTSPAGSPAHIPGVAIEGDASGAPSLRNFGFAGDEDRTMDDVGGEWEREGLGRGLEERLEALQGFGMT